jgi:putative hemolysin
MDGQYPIAEFLLHFEINKTEELDEINTLAGLILNQLKRIPKTGEKVKWQGFQFEVLDMDGVKIDKVLVKRS